MTSEPGARATQAHSLPQSVARGDARVNLLGVPIDTVDVASATSRVVNAACSESPFAVTALATHGVIEGLDDEAFRGRLWDFGLVVPDGQAVRWAVNLVSAAGLEDRVAGPHLMLSVLAEAQRLELPVALYGSTQETLDLLIPRIGASFPALTVSWSAPSKFRPYHSDDELQGDVDSIAASGAKIVFVGLGCPRQEVWAYEVARRGQVTVLAVGAAFDFHAGLLRRPSKRIQRMGLEWAYRLLQEPRRLWRRYATTNPRFLWGVLKQFLSGRTVAPVQPPPPGLPPA